MSQPRSRLITSRCAMRPCRVSTPSTRSIRPSGPSPTCTRCGPRSPVVSSTPFATDHAPHAPERKEEPFDEAPPRGSRPRDALAVAYGAMCTTSGKSDDAADGWVPAGNKPAMKLADLLAALSWKPARIAGLDQESHDGPGGHGGHGGPIRPGALANLMIFDPSAEWVVDRSRQASRSRNTPYAGRRLTGRVRHTLLAGEAVVIDGEAQR